MVRPMTSATGRLALELLLLAASPSACGGEASKDAAQQGGRSPQNTATSAGSAGTPSTNASASGGANAGLGGSSDAAGAAAVAGATSCTCDSPGCGACPADSSVLVDAGERSFRIDATETTNRDYAAFIAANPIPTGQPAACSWNGSYIPPNEWPLVGVDDLPVVWVDWCDAYAYCKWAKKRLCGNLGGGELAYGSTRDASASQWYRACSNNATLNFPYGSTYESARCNGKDRVATEAGVLPVGTQAGCEGGVAGLFDMSGNVWEWEDSCVGSSGATDNCHLRGGSFWSEANLMDCTTATDSYTRASLNKNIGFRCCSNP